jgi:hypothetical protein
MEPDLIFYKEAQPPEDQTRQLRLNVECWLLVAATGIPGKFLNVFVFTQDSSPLCLGSPLTRGKNKVD